MKQAIIQVLEATMYRVRLDISLSLLLLLVWGLFSIIPTPSTIGYFLTMFCFFGICLTLIAIIERLRYLGHGERMRKVSGWIVRFSEGVNSVLLPQHLKQQQEQQSLQEQLRRVYQERLKLEQLRTEQLRREIQEHEEQKQNKMSDQESEKR